MKSGLLLFLLLCGAALGVACGGGASTPAAEPAAESAAAVVEAVEVATEVSADAPASACEAFYRFCVTSVVSGSVEATATAGVGSNIDSCAAWAAPGEARILELPLMLNAGQGQITVALTRIAAYTGPGRYELVSVSQTGIPDMFPTISVAERTFGEGAGATAVVTVNADGSGTLDTTGLAEIASLQVTNPDPTARVDFSMQWACQDI